MMEKLRGAYSFMLVAALLGYCSGSIRKDGLVELYMENHCRTHFYQYFFDNDRVYIDKSIVLLLANNPQGDTKMACVATFAAKDSKHRMLLHFESLDINYHMGTTDRLHIFDGFDAQSELTPHSGLYGKYAKGVYEFSSGNIRDYQSQGHALSLYFIGTPSPRFPGFKVILTVFKDPFLNGSCEHTYYRCSTNGFCISHDLVCNGYPNCGDNDNSDETQCDSNSAPIKHYDMQDLGVLIGCGIAIIILLVVVLWMGILCIKKASLRRRQYREWLAACRQRPDPPDNGRIFWPRWAYMEPPPLYSEDALEGQHPPIQPFELPPPYSIEEHDQATLIANEAPEMPPIPITSTSLHQGDQRTATGRSRSNPQRSRHSRRAARGVRPTDPNAPQHRHSSSRRQRHHASREIQSSVPNSAKDEPQDNKAENSERRDTLVNDTTINVPVVEVGIASRGHQFLIDAPELATVAPADDPLSDLPAMQSDTGCQETECITANCESLNMNCVKTADQITEVKSDHHVSETCGESTA